jgi:HSP20 family protein
MISDSFEQDDGKTESGRLYLSETPIDSDPVWNAAESEGKLSVDVLETENELVVIATMAGTKPEDIFLHLHNDFLTIRGSRVPNIDQPLKFYYEECYWGKFSRTIVLPTDVRGEMASSEYRNGVLTIKLPKAEIRKNIPILVIDD